MALPRGRGSPRRLTKPDQGRPHPRTGPTLVRMPRVIQVNLYEAKTQLSRLMDRAAAGEEIVIAKAGRPLASGCRRTAYTQRPKG